MRVLLLVELRIRPPRQLHTPPSKLPQSHTWELMRLARPGYAAKASSLDAASDHDAVARSEANRQVAEMTAAVARALSHLPSLGENRNGPLGPGRLCLGQVGEAIREIQRLLTERK